MRWTTFLPINTLTFKIPFSHSYINIDLMDSHLDKVLELSIEITLLAKELVARRITPNEYINKAEAIHDQILDLLIPDA